MRFPLTTLANAGTLIFNHWSTTNNGSLRLTQGAGSTMYWGSHNSSNQLRLFSWVDGQNSVNFWNVGVGQWSAPSGSTAPNGVNWLARDSRITGAAVGSGRIVDGGDQGQPSAVVLPGGGDLGGQQTDTERAGHLQHEPGVGVLGVLHEQRGHDRVHRLIRWWRPASGVRGRCPVRSVELLGDRVCPSGQSFTEHRQVG